MCCHQDNHAKKKKKLNMIWDGKLWRCLSLSRCIEWWKLASLKHDWMNAQRGTNGESRALLKFNNIRHSLLSGAKKNSLMVMEILWNWRETSLPRHKLRIDSALCSSSQAGLSLMQSWSQIVVRNEGNNKSSSKSTFHFSEFWGAYGEIRNQTQI